MTPSQQQKQTSSFKIYTKESAPKESREALNRLEKSVGGIPNLAGTMAESATLIDGFVTLREIIQKHSSFTPLQREVIFLTNATANGCNYCQAIHSTFAIKTGLSQDIVSKIRKEQSLDDPKLDALVKFARSVARNKGRVSNNELETFFAAGFEKSHVLEIIACLAQSVMANYTNHIAHTEPDEFIKPQYQSSVS